MDTPSQLVTSPPSYFSVPQLLANGETVLDWASADGKSRNYLPFNTAVISNTSTSDIQLFINQMDDRPMIVVAGSIGKLSPEDGAIWGFRIKNIGTATITAGQVRIVSNRVATGNSILGMLIDKFVR